MKSYYNNNGELIQHEERCLMASNRSYLYGDGLFETIKVINAKPCNFKNHYLRLIAGAERLKIRIPNFYTQVFFEEKIQELIDFSQIKKGAKIRMSIDRESGGGYEPISNDASYFIELIDGEKNNFELNVKGLEIDLCTSMKKQVNPLSNYKTKNGLLFVLAALEAQERNLDDVLICNDKNIIIESTRCNLFLVSNGVLYTPSLSDGCLAGTMRMYIINLALENNIKVYECSVMPQNLLAADEVFLCNAIRGIQWVGGYRTKRYQNSFSKKMIDLINSSYGL